MIFTGSYKMRKLIYRNQSKLASKIQRHIQDFHKRLRWKALQQLLATKIGNYCCKFFNLRNLPGPWSRP